MKRILCITFLCLHLTGCNSYVSRMVVESFRRFSEPIQPAPHRTESPILPDINLSVLWVGHATALIQIHDKVFITDPLLTETIGMLVRRKIEPGIDPASLSKVDYTLISHLHFDHLSYGSLDMLPKAGKLLIPDGVAAYTPELGFAETREMKAWEVLEEDGVRITAVPVQHFSGRYGFDSGWMADCGYTGWVIQYKDKTVFFAGDTGYDADEFKEIGRRFSVDVAIIPIAPSRSEGLGSRVHVSPAGAVQIFEDVKAAVMIPVHHRTFFQGADTASTYPQELLRIIAQKKGFQERIRILDIGERYAE